MKKYITFILIFLNLSHALAVCDFANDIKEGPNNTYIYSKDCHIEVGKTVKSASLLGSKIDLMEKQLDLKDLQISKYEERTQLWMDTSMKMNDKLAAYENRKNQDFWVSFGLGVSVTILSVWAAGQIIK